MSSPILEMGGRDVLVRPPVKPSKEVKQELGGRWDASASAWRVAPTSHNILRLIEFYGDRVLDGAPEVVRDLALEPWGFKGFTDEERLQALEHPSWEELYEFQREGVEYLVCNPHATSLVGLSWGLGKAATSIVAADLVEAKRVLVLSPLSLGQAWLKELKRWGQPQDAEPVRATAGDTAPGQGWTITNAETIQEVVLRDERGEILQPKWIGNAKLVKEWRESGPTKINAKGKREPVRERIVRVSREYLEVEWDLIIVDESVLYKNRKAVKAGVLKELRKKNDPFLWKLSASPTTKYRDDLWKQLNIMAPRAWSSYWRFAEFFCLVDKEGWGWTIEGDRPDVDLHHYLRDFLWVMSEKKAGIELPEYNEYPLEVEAGKRQRKALDGMLTEWVAELEDAPGEHVEADTWLTRITRLQQITSNLGALPKADGSFHKAGGAKTELLSRLITEGELQTPLLVWTWFVETTNVVETALGKNHQDLSVASVTGQTSKRLTDERLEAFAEGELDVLVLQMGVGKFGHTFTKTRSIYYHDRTFDSDAYVQSRRRVRRIGLKHNPTLIVPKIPESADQLIDANLEGKLRSISKLTNADLADLLRSLAEDA